MFTFGQTFGSFSYYSRRSESPHNSYGSYEIGISGGMGVAWMPFEHVGVFVSEGIDLLIRNMLIL